MWITFTTQYGVLGVYCGNMSIHIKIYDTDTVFDIARKVYEDFDVMASCTIYGFVLHEEKKQLIPKGELVVDCLKRMDADEHLKKNAIGSMMRQYKYKKDAVGGPIAHKIFVWEKRIIDSEPRYTIWRFQ